MILAYLTNDDQTVKALWNAYSFALSQKSSGRFVACVEDPTPTNDWQLSQLYGLVNDMLKPGDELVVYDMSSLGMCESDLQELLVLLGLKGIELHILKYKMRLSTKKLKDMQCIYALYDTLNAA